MKQKSTDVEQSAKVQVHKQTQSQTEKQTNGSNPEKNTKSSTKAEEMYNIMLDKMKIELQRWSDKVEPNLENLLDKAKQKMGELGETSEFEMTNLQSYIKRDLEDALYFLKDGKKTFSQWLYFDFKLIEKNMVDTYQTILKQVKCEWLELTQRMRHVREYHSGEVIAMGTLACTQCKTELNFTKSTSIPVCPECQGTHFVRKVQE